MYYPSEYYSTYCEPIWQEQLRQTQINARKVYINQNFVPLPSDKTNNVHINPNFKHRVLVNPKFKGTLPQTSKNIYINPVFQQTISKNSSILPELKCEGSQTTIYNANSLRNLNVEDATISTNVTRFSKMNNETVSTHQFSDNISTKNQIVHVSSGLNTDINSKYKIVTKNKLIRLPASINKTSRNYKISTKNKLIRFPYVTKEVAPKINSKNILVPSPRKLITSSCRISTSNAFYTNKRINSKYKIDHGNNIKTTQSFNVISQHKIIRKSLQPDKVINKENKYKIDRRIIDIGNGLKLPKHKITKKAYLMNLDPSREIIKVSKNKSKLIKKLPRFIKIKDQVYKFNSNYDTLYFVSLNKHKVNKIKPSKIVIHNYTFVLMPTGVYKRQHLNKMKINSRMLKKDNNPCVRYRQRGFCKENESGTCLKKHDPNQIRMCSKFLQGACLNDKCLLSHKVSPEKMPTCKYYLDGFCHKDNCPYLHIKLSKTAEICKQFLEGYCSLGLECIKRHQFLCPTFEAKGSCPKRNCKFPHKIEDASRQNQKSRNKIANYKQKNTKKKENEINDLQDKKDNTSDLLRYYEMKQDLIELISEKKTLSLSERPKVGDLPSFIAIE